MKAKSFKIIGDAAHRDVGLLFENQINAWFQANPQVEVKDLQVSYTPQVHGYGEALVVILYEVELGDVRKGKGGK